MTRARHILYGLSAALLAAAAFNVTALASPEWYRSGVLDAAGVALAEAGLVIVILEWVARAASSPRAPLYLLTFAIPALLLPAGYVCLAAWVGRENARADTWHLMSLFTLTNFLFALLLSGALLLIVKVVVTIRSRA